MEVKLFYQAELVMKKESGEQRENKEAASSGDKGEPKRGSAGKRADGRAKQGEAEADNQAADGENRCPHG